MRTGLQDSGDSLPRRTVMVVDATSLVGGVQARQGRALEALLMSMADDSW
jgi:hypothetical protein